MKWGLCYSLILTLLGSFYGGKELPQAFHVHASIHSAAVYHSASGIIHGSDRPSCYLDIGEFEVEEEDNDHFSGSKIFQSLSLPQVRNAITRAALFPPQKILKLYILFHSWKSFLFL
jgi:hypothetical protein